MSENLFVLSDKRVTRFVESLRGAKREYDREVEDFNVLFTSNPAYAIEWRAHHVMRAQARWEIAMNLELAEGEDVDLAAIAAWLGTELNRLQHARNGESGSTSTLTNLKERIQHSVIVQYIGMLIG